MSGRILRPDIGIDVRNYVLELERENAELRVELERMEVHNAEWASRYEALQRENAELRARCNAITKAGHDENVKLVMENAELRAAEKRYQSVIHSQAKEVAELREKLDAHALFTAAVEQTPKQWSTAQAPTVEAIANTMRGFQAQKELAELKARIEGARKVYLAFFVDDGEEAVDAYMTEPPFSYADGAPFREGWFRAVPVEEEKP